MNPSGEVLAITVSNGALGRAEAAEVIAFLVSDEARAVTGALIPAVGRV